MLKRIISKIIEREDLNATEAEEAMAEIMSGKASDAQIASFLTALRMKGETVKEITAFARTMRSFSHRINPRVAGILVDTCGTGGDKVKTFNISTIAAFVAAGAKIPVAKHGNRSVTSRCGSADLMEALGMNLAMTPQMVEKSIEEVGIGFIYAPSFHPAMKHAAAPRREIGVRTVFNLLGPLTNPANAQAQVVGVYKEGLTEPIARVLSNLGVSRALVVHGTDGLDEISIVGPTKVTALWDGVVSTSYLRPSDLRLETVDRSMIEGSTPQVSALTALKVLNSHGGEADRKVKAQREAVMANAAAAIFTGGGAETIRDGVEAARESIESGAAYEKLKSLIRFSGGEVPRLEELERLD